MKSVKKENKKQTESTFPCLMVHPVTGIILLATSHDEYGFSGTIVHAPEDRGQSLGRAKQSFWSHQFVPFDGEVTLSND